MCRFLVYKGREVSMSDLLTRPEQSLILQSYRAQEREEPLNGDGFGVGWYEPEIDPVPGVFTSITPAWSNRNLYRLAEKIRSSCFFAHVRAASHGTLVSEINCHPFQYDRFLWMHNGAVGEFHKIKRRLRESLSDEAYDLIQGTTDSEHVFALFLNRLMDRLEDYSIEDLRDSMVAVIHQLNAWTRQENITEPSLYNFAVTDGQSVVATRYVNVASREPASLYVSKGDRLECQEGRYLMLPAKRRPNAAIIASEPLTAERSNWEQVPRNHLVMITPELHVRVVPIG